VTDRASIPRRGPTTRGRLRIYLGAGVGKTFALADVEVDQQQLRPIR
jgi:K+-sensing histidine kinase KdpD